MVINTLNSIVLRKDGNIELNTKVFTTSDPMYGSLSQLYMACKGKSDADKQSIFDDMIAMNIIDASLFVMPESTSSGVESIPVVETPASEKVENAIGKMIEFFKDFEFTPNFRFLNTLSWALQTSPDSAKDYIRNYFALIDSPYVNDVNAKLTCAEFKNILSNFSALAPTHTVNSRFDLYYGSQGTGKTTIAMEKADNRCIVCNSSMLPSDLMEDFIFVDGKATFKPSSLWTCMEEGKPIVLDEVNLLPFDSLRFLQGILDNKPAFEYKGNVVHIHDGFKVLGTMNLSVNGSTYGLPEPLVDRCASIQHYELTAHQLMGAIL